MKMKSILFACTIIVVNLFTAGILQARLGFAPDEEGFIRNWLLLAPIPLPAESTGAEAVDKQHVPSEAALKPKAGDKITVGGKELAWKEIKAADYFFDVNAVLGTPTENSVAYAVVYVLADNEMPGLKIKMGSNDQAKLYLNGKQLLRFEETRTLDKDTETAENVTLNKGVNTIVFKVINEANNWQGCVRFTDKDNKPIKMLKLRLEPEAK